MELSMISRRFRSTPTLVRALMAVGACAAMLVVAPSPSAAMRHLRLVRSSPAADSSYARSPEAIRLWLSEPTEAAASRISLATSAGAAVELQAVTRDTAKTAPLVAKLVKPLANGAYKVTWKAMSKDGHVVNGAYSFKVDASK